MKTKTAILVDGGWMTRELKKLLKVGHPTSEQVYNNAISVLLPNEEELYRLFYYDAKPYDGTHEHPISRQQTDFSANPSYAGRERFYRELNTFPQVALRLGTLGFRGWKIGEQLYTKMLNGTLNPADIKPDDILPNFQQKGVDMRIGIDIASLVFKKIVSRIILFCGDTDMVPAMKLARVEGVQIVLVQIGKKKLSSPLVEDSDFVRELKLQNSSATATPKT